MNNSPGTPGGTNRRSASSTYVRMLSIGRPIGTTSGTDSTVRIDRIVAYVVVSVGP